MTASQMMDDIDSIGAKINPIHRQMQDEIHACEIEWYELRQAKVASHDEAVELLLRVQDHVRALHTATRIIASQLNKVLYTKEESQ